MSLTSTGGSCDTGTAPFMEISHPISAASVHMLFPHGLAFRNRSEVWSWQARCRITAHHVVDGNRPLGSSS